MSTIVLTGYYSNGYVAAAGVTTLSITSTGRVTWNGVGLDAGYITLANDGVVETGHIGNNHGGAVYGDQGGAVFNGSLSDRAASIEGFNSGVILEGAPSKVVNFATILGEGENGVALYDGGSVTNGAPNGRAALIQGYVDGVDIFGGPGTVVNFGTTVAESRFGVWLQQGGSVTNGSVSATRATIGGYEYGIEIDGPATVSNFGDIYSAGHLSFGVAMHSGGTLTNGSATSHAAVISGYSLGVYLGDGALAGAQGTLSNFGTIESLGTGDQAFGYACSGILVNTQGAIINGAAHDSVALIEGYQGIYDYTTAPLTITNFGVIDGEGGVAVQFKSANDELVVEAGCTFVGQVLGGGGTLDLASGTGTIVASGGIVTVSGSMATTTFQDFGALMIGAGASFSAKKAVTIGAGQSVIDAGTLTLKGAVKNGGTLEAAGGVLTVMGAVSGKGVAVVNGGILDLAGAFTENVTFAGSTGTLALGQSQGYGGKITGFSTSGGTSLDLADIAFVSPTEASFSGNATGGGLTVTDGTHTARITLVGDYLGATFTAAADAGSGTTVTASAAHARPPPHALVSAMAGLGAPAGPAAHLGEARPAREAMLSLPRVVTA